VSFSKKLPTHLKHNPCLSKAVEARNKEWVLLNHGMVQQCRNEEGDK
jgi:hypothetical protein